MVYAALLRGINVGGNNMVSMKSLKENFERLAFEHVRTYINSGNVIFRAADRDPRALEDRIDRMLEQQYRLTGRTVVRTKGEMVKVVAALDREDLSDPDWRCNVIFLRSTVDPRRTLKSIALQPEIERVVCCPGTWLWSARLRDLNRSAMMKLGKTPLYREMTVRNVNTTRAVLALMQQTPDSQPLSGA
ncbi:MAG TPA: DUF1697 domain-containing protein [Vicinamibacterales bacterium]|nr:DUF1697 domain-containing protein [Vicinamibacterales bacterium]